MAKRADGSPVDHFIALTRRRYLLRDLLVVAAASAAADLLALLAVRAGNRYLGAGLPEIAIGLALFAVLGVATLRRNTPPRVAARADRGLRVQDRLSSFLDFRGRADVDPAFRDAQAAEAQAALAAVDLRRGIRIHRALWAAPLAFGWMLYADYFAFFTPFDLPFTVRSPRVASVRRGPPPGGDDADTRRRDADAPGGAEAPAGDSTGKPPAAAPKPEEGAAAPPENPATAADETPGGGGDAAGGGGGTPAVFGEPARLFSETVGKRLTPVAEAGPAGTPTAPELELPLRGRISFNLVPADGEGGEASGQGGKPGVGAAAGLGVTIDYDAVPPAYRQQVRRYFNVLIKLFQGGTGGT